MARHMYDLHRARAPPAHPAVVLQGRRDQADRVRPPGDGDLSGQSGGMPDV